MLNRVGGCVTAAENNAANAGLLDERQEKEAESSAKFFVKDCSGGRTQRGVKNCVAPRSQRMQSRLHAVSLA